MNILEITGFLSKQYDESYTTVDITEDINLIVSKYSDLFDKNHLASTGSYKEFYEANPMFSAVVDDFNSTLKDFKREVFFALSTGLVVNGLPGELVLAVQKAMEITSTPNKMLSVIDKSVLSRYMGKNDNTGYLLKKLIDEMYGYTVSFVSNFRSAVKNKDVVEIYISNIDNILLCDQRVLEFLPHEDDFRELEYSTTKGIIIKATGTPLRTLISDFGITTDDLDLRKVV